MRRSWALVRAFVFVVFFFTLLAAIPDTASAQSIEPSRRCSGSGPLPSNLRAAVLETYVDAILQRSATFRLQCEAIARYASRLRITIAVAKFPANAGYRAKALVRKYAYGFVNVDIVIGFGQNYVELLAHEFEHVLEQAEGVNLREQQRVGEASCTEDQLFETPRAAAAGLAVWNEFQAAAPPAATHTKTR